MKGSVVYPCGCATYSKHPSRYAEGAPPLVDYANGAWVGYRGEKWVDLTSGMGAVILGHQHPNVDAMVRSQMECGIAYPLPSHLEEGTAEILLNLLTWERAESVRFGKNGADVTTSAVRLARAVTGRNEVLYCDYHGYHDWSMTELPWDGGVLGHGSRKVDAYDLPITNVEGAAAVVIEGSSSVTPGTHRDKYWERLRQRCDDSGCLLILDEMVTGFRMAPGGAAESLGIEPDLACFGKAMANGLPLSAIVGPHEYLKRYETDVFFSLTHAGEALSLAAAQATMDVVREQDVPYKLRVLGEEIIALFRAYGAESRIKYGYPQRLVFDFTRDELGVMLEHGVLSAGYANLTLSHVDDNEARSAIMRALAAVLSA